jgi:peptide-methionine (R)-S-oxide reductase
MKRRSLLQGMLAAGLWNALAGREAAAQPAVKDMKGIEELQKSWKTLLAEGFKAPLPTEPLKLADAEWKKRLSPASYSVLREEGTERAGTSPLNNEKREGVFVCAGCDLPVFTSAMKYESGTGWPSFFGHVFDDGPRPTGQRWCNNGVALKFVPRTGKA